MTLAELQKRIDHIEAIAGDDESAHWEQDKLYADVLAHFAEVAPAELGELARKALTVQDIHFSRWYA